MHSKKHTIFKLNMYNSTHIPDVIQNDELMLETVSSEAEVVYLEEVKKKAKAEASLIFCFFIHEARAPRNKDDDVVYER